MKITVIVVCEAATHFAKTLQHSTQSLNANNDSIFNQTAGKKDIHHSRLINQHWFTCSSHKTFAYSHESVTRMVCLR